MKLLVFSDTHNSPSRMLEVFHRERAAACIYLGDGIRDVDFLQRTFPHVPVYRVQGNCDFASVDPEEGLAPFGGVLFFFTHGHRHHVKQGLGELWQAAHARGADVALFGHTHIPHYEIYSGIHLFNPGSLTQPRSGPGSYGIITIQNSTPSFEIVNFR